MTILKDWRIKYGLAVLGALLMLLLFRSIAKGKSLFRRPGSKLIYEEKIPLSYRSAFISKVISISNYLRIDPNWLMQVMNKETGGAFSPSIKNPTSSATGLIQFMAATAASLGTSTSALKRMSAVEQLDWVKKYLEPYKGRMDSFPETYLAVFYPAGIDKPDNWKFPSWVYRANKGIDLNRNGIITIGEFKKWMNR